ncbi:DUF4115 domain-containing protein [Paraglaciecola aquimarina]|uniref:DUF4115 domain-containing protein n=1 Tax=Paraglaciecola aquimarina TaxID=1235557 RepID=A0ABU3SWM3_9ALTE|nr:RodZ domain-containing protein [Paraglaciecola aquimarina]MDU0354411.1 DUF4115 domain-containing protein [Paraglaciecola aquimarina]
MSEEQEVVVIVGPGEILKKARESAKLSIDDIANKIRLKKTLIEDLESDNYDINISLTFIKGYLKLYAKQVSVPEAEIVAAFEGLNTQKKEPAKLQSFSRRFNHQANDDKLMLVTYLIVGVVIALAVVWWFQQSDTGQSLFSEQSIDSSQTSETVSLQPYSDEPVVQVPNVAAGASEPSLTDVGATDEIPEPIESVEQATTESSTDSETNFDQNIVETPDEVATVIEDASATTTAALESAQTSSTTDESQTTATSDAAPVELVFEFLDNCWTNISDATGEDIAYGVKTKGRVMTIAGIPPFVVTLGAPEFVKISYAGEPVDMSFVVLRP